MLPLVPLRPETFFVGGTFGSLLLAAPHYGATLLRVYGNAEDRRGQQVAPALASPVSS